MTDHSDLIAELQDRAASYRLGGPSSEHTALLLDQAAIALSSQSLSLSEAREEIERLRKALEAHAEAFEPRHGVIGTPGSFKRWEHDKQKSAHTLALDALASSALENSKATLADATSNPPLSDLSSLREGAEVAVKPLEWETDPLGNMLAIAACGWATVEVRSDGRWRWSLGGVAAGTERRKEDAIKMVTNSYEHRIRSALVSGSREDGDA